MELLYLDDCRLVNLVTASSSNQQDSDLQGTMTMTRSWGALTVAQNGRFSKRRSCINGLFPLKTSQMKGVAHFEKQLKATVGCRISTSRQFRWMKPI